MGHKQIHGGLMPSGKLRIEKLSSLVMAGHIYPEKLISHRFVGLDSVVTVLMLTKDKPRDLIKPFVLIEE